MSGHQRTLRGHAVAWYFHPDGSHRWARLGDTVQVADSDVARWDEVEAEVPEANPPVSGPVMPEPPRVGRGSGRDMWAAHAESLGVTFPDDATRDDIIAAVDARRQADDDVE